MCAASWLTWQTIADFASANFTTSLIGAFAGAWGGAYAIQRIADRAKTRDILKQEVQSARAAIEICGGICNSYFNVKEQFIQGLNERYSAQYNAIHRHHLAIVNCQISPDTPLEVGMVDLQSLEPIKTKVDRLENYIIDRLTVTGRPRLLVGVLAQSIESLNAFIVTRSALLEEYRSMPADLNARVAFLYGLPRNGTVDARFATNVQGLYRQTDDCIQFCMMICVDLTRFGRKAREEYVRRFGNDIERVPRISWDEQKARGLFPPSEDYETWETNFVERVRSTKGRWFARMWYGKRQLLRKSVATRWLDRIIRRII
jgi:hypothetical protein